MSLFTTMALASTYNIVPQFTGQFAALNVTLTELETYHGDLNKAIGGLIEDAKDMLDQQITGDYFVSNDLECVITHKGLKMHEFTVPAGESLEFIANITTNEVEESNYFNMWLQNEAGERIISAVEDGNEGPQSNGNPNDDNLSLSLIYKQ